MKHTILAIFCFAFTTNISAESYSADTIVLDFWVNNSWQQNTRIISTYDGCRQLSTITQTMVGSEWMNEQKRSYTYTGGDNLSEVLSQQWNGNDWDNSSKTTYTYDGSFNELTSIRQDWTGSAWQNSSRETNTYDAGNHLMSTLSETSADGVTWANESLTTYTNNADGTVNLETNQNWNIGTLSWMNTYRTSYTYNADKSLHQSTDQNWDGISTWVNESRNTITYDAQGRELTYLYESWETNIWVNNSLSTITYHGTGNQFESFVTQTWDNDTWKLSSRDDYTYDNEDNVYQRVLQYADENSQLINSLRYTYHYKAGCALPLKLLTFSATLSGKDVLLKWTTTNETNTGYFDVQSSKDADKFEKAGSVKASTNTTQKTNYQFVDANPAAIASGKIYYRLKMVDRDGKFSYSKIAFVSLPQAENYFSIFPTVVKDNLFLIRHSSYSGNADIRIIDQAGRQVYTQRLNMLQATNQAGINVSTLNSGVYYIQVITKDGSNTVKFFKQ